MAGLEWKGSLQRFQKCAAELLSLEAYLIIDEDDEFLWEIIGKDFCFKSIFLFCDLNRVISGASDEQKMTLTDLGNRLFHYMEELDSAVKSRDVSLTQICYGETALALQEVMAALMNLNAKHSVSSEATALKYQQVKEN